MDVHSSRPLGYDSSEASVTECADLKRELPSMAGAPSGSAQLGLKLARRSRELGRIAKPFEHETTVRMDQPQLEAFAPIVTPGLVQNAVA